MKKVIGIFVILLCLTLTIIYKYDDQEMKTNSTKRVVGIVSDSSTKVNQNQKMAWIDLTEKRIVKELPIDNIGHGLEATISPDNQKMAENKWVNRMDLNLFLLDLQNNKLTQLTGNINGEISRISWIDDNTILYCFTSHNSKKYGLGMYLYTYNIKNKTNTPFFKNQSSNYRYDTVRYIPKLNKVIYAQGKADDYFLSIPLGKAASNQLYWCNKDGTMIQKLTEIKNRTIGRVVPTYDNKNLIIEAYYVQKSVDKSDLYTYNFESKKTTLLLASSEKYPEHWNIISPAYNTVWFRSKGKIYEINTVNKNIKEVKIMNMKPGEEIVNFDLNQS
ncbi:hypothetical protein [Aneurinibacillus terranovensis]|uniref:hypothetical protein n=1 Tax=Aneurinibacillus terranovensis TaxID=278991 RepID=UPI00040A39A5|nr:hypothetical protein [Aneurinibacillus terranovensis]